MTIQLIRGGLSIAAQVYYNFRQACNVVVVTLAKTPTNDQADYVLLYDLHLRKWRELDHLEDTEPLFFLQILYKLSNVLRDAEKNLNNFIVPHQQNILS